MKNAHGGGLRLVTLQAEVCNFIKSITPVRVFFTSFKFYRRYQIAQSITYENHVFKNGPSKICGRNFTRLILEYLPHILHLYGVTNSMKNVNSRFPFNSSAFSIHPISFWYVINPFHVTGLFLYPWKTSETQRFFYVFRGYRKRPVT